MHRKEILGWMTRTVKGSGNILIIMTVKYVPSISCTAYQNTL